MLKNVDIWKKMFRNVKKMLKMKENVTNCLKMLKMKKKLKKKNCKSIFKDI